MTRLKDIPQLQSDGRNLPAVMEAVREVIQTFRGYRGDKMDRALTLRDLDLATARSVIGGGTIGGGGGSTIVLPGGGGGGGSPEEPDLTPPPTPSGLVLTAGLTSIFVGCDVPSYTQGHGHDRTVVYGAKWPAGDPEPVFMDAVELWQFQGPASAYPTETGTRWCIWIKWRSMDGVLSTDPAGGTNGVQATTGKIGNADLGPLIIEAANLADGAVDLGSDAVTGTITDPARFGALAVGYTVTQYLLATSGVMGNLIVDNSQIANLSAAKLTVGDGTVGGNLKSSNYVSGTSGWLATPAGYFEARNGVFGGSIYATAGLIGGITIQANNLRSSNYDGAGAGWQLTAAGALHLPNGSVTAQALTAGSAQNLLFNASFLSADGWTTADSIGGCVFVRDGAGSPWYPVGGHTLAIQQPNTNPTGDAWWASAPFPVVAGQRYEHSVYTGAHRCQVFATLVFYNAADTYLGEGSTNTNTAEAGGGQLLSGYKRVSGFVVAPAGTAVARLLLRKKGTIAPNGDSWAFFTRPFVAEALPNATQPSPWGPEGFGTYITPAGIVTPSLQAISGVMGNLYAGSVRGGSFNDYGWPASGGGYYLGPEGMKLGSVVSGQYFQVTAAGQLYAPGMTIDGGVLTISQANVINTLNVAGGAVASTWPASGSAATIFLPVTVPSGQTHRIAMVCVQNGGGSSSSPLAASSISCNGVTVAVHAGSIGSTGGDNDSTIWGYNSTTLTFVEDLTGPTTKTYAFTGLSGLNKTMIATVLKRP